METAIADRLTPPSSIFVPPSLNDLTRLECLHSFTGGCSRCSDSVPFIFKTRSAFQRPAIRPDCVSRCPAHASVSPTPCPSGAFGLELQGSGACGTLLGSRPFLAFTHVPRNPCGQRLILLVSSSAVLLLPGFLLDQQSSNSTSGFDLTPPFPRVP